ncbi:hypothetical protein ABPG77_000580 [Micractinium sp. CCAP 211/92]
MAHNGPPVAGGSACAVSPAHSTASFEPGCRAPGGASSPRGSLAHLPAQHREPLTACGAAAGAAADSRRSYAPAGALPAQPPGPAGSGTRLHATSTADEPDGQLQLHRLLLEAHKELAEALAEQRSQQVQLAAAREEISTLRARLEAAPRQPPAHLHSQALDLIVEDWQQCRREQAAQRATLETQQAQQEQQEQKSKTARKTRLAGLLNALKSINQ